MKSVNIIIGGAGFIGSNLVCYFHNNNQICYVVDDLSLGSYSNISFLNEDYFFKLDVLDYNIFFNLIRDIKNKHKDKIIKIWHLAANSDIKSGVDDLTIDLNKTFLTTFNILRCMEELKLSALNFASSSAIYGDHGDVRLNELSGNLNPRSSYGAMKLASEALISASAEKFLDNVCIFRFPNVVGIPATHGILYDFKHKLVSDPFNLNVLGDGSQTKPYLYIDDLISAMIHIDKLISSERMKIFNVGPLDDGISVKEIANIFVEYYKHEINICYGSMNRGWIGDVPKFFYDTSKLRLTGWEPALNSEQAIRKTISLIV